MLVTEITVMASIAGFTMEIFHNLRTRRGQEVAQRWLREAGKGKGVAVKRPDCEWKVAVKWPGSGCEVDKKANLVGAQMHWLLQKPLFCTARQGVY